MIDRAELRAGIFLPPFHPNAEDPTLAMERDFELVEFLDQLGFAEAWVGEHHSGGFEIYGSPELFIATAAERTKRIRLGTGVISLPYHNPFMVANRIVQLDHQTRGRAMFGFGPGLLATDAMMLGIDPTELRGRMAELIDIITRLLAGETVTQTSSWFKLVNARLHLKPYTWPRPELAVASSVTPSGGKAAGDFDLGLISVAVASIDGYDALDFNWNVARDTAAAKGRTMDPRKWRLMAPFHIAETREKAVANVLGGFDTWAEYLNSVSALGPAGIGLPSVQEIIDGERGVIGTPDDAVRVLEKFWEKTGGFGAILLLANNWADWEATKRSYELFARYVMPKFTGRNEWRESSMAWARENKVAFTERRVAATRQAIDRYKAETKG